MSRISALILGPLSLLLCEDREGAVGEPGSPYHQTSHLLVLILDFQPQNHEESFCHL